MTFTLPDLPYAENALEPAIDERTMNIHRTKHHAGYVAKLNAAVEASGDLAGKSLEELCAMVNELPASVQGAVRNNGGGHFNHSLFWTILAPKGTGGAPSAELAKAIDAAYGSMDGFRDAFSDAAATRFGSGWAWLCKKADGSVAVCSTANQDNPLMKGIADCGGTPILGLDVWEHAYYLNYQNRRPDYISAFFDVVNWSEVSRRYAEA